MARRPHDGIAVQALCMPRLCVAGPDDKLLDARSSMTGDDHRSRLRDKDGADPRC